ncbi:MAG TPA: RagB/SusD family nutrient uptake outer membrane protein [Paludibacter sp.]|nr:RagB/SusD family nutrient uptake outer membrane protein [Paludibacter sp.]HOS45859.1 RagB/SusD family nutrient uptake outer membrane protein [Paludibacter sp.]HPM09584.1 RagB/SusD family nutrient uptake outer membrane protein [Paludibacter sp.]
MKKIKILFLATIFLVTACEDVLNKRPLDMISDATLWSETVLIDDYLNQCYAEMKFYFEMPYPNAYNWFESTHSVTIADEAMSGWVSAPQSHWIQVQGGVYEWWGYPTIRKLNIFIEKMETLELEDAYKKQRIAEARFLRAFAYFNLVKRYGGVPLITRAQQLNDSDEELYRERDKENTVYEFILTELDAIINDLPEAYSSGDTGRPTKYAVLALKSRASMYAASIATWGNVLLDGLVGIPKDKAKAYWQICYDASKEIITSNVFALYNKHADKVQNYRNIFLDEVNSEVIFSERFDGLSGKGHSWDMWLGPSASHVWSEGQQAMVFLEMVESYDNIDGTSGMIDRSKVGAHYLWTVEELWGKKDPRFRASVYTHGTSWSDKDGKRILDFHNGIQTPSGVVTNGAYKGVLARAKDAKRGTPFGILKYLDESRAVVHERLYSSTDYIIFRLGEIYLNYAEAAIELEKDGDALWAVNEIRKRAGMPVLGTITRDAVRKERKIELAFEGNRYFDVRRWRTAVNDLTRSYNGLRFILDGASMVEGNYDVSTQKFSLRITPNVSGKNPPYFTEKHYYLPIGLSRTGNNPNLIENPGYY